MFELSLNGANVPDLKVNRRYVEMIRGMVTRDGKPTNDSDKEAIQFVKNKIDSAVVHLGDQTTARHANAYDAGDLTTSSKAPVETASDDRRNFATARASTSRPFRAW